jgi:hypothetical protein
MHVSVGEAPENRYLADFARTMMTCEMNVVARLLGHAFGHENNSSIKK